MVNGGYALDASPRPAEGVIALERFPGEAEEAKRVNAASEKHDSHIPTNGVTSRYVETI